MLCIRRHSLTKVVITAVMRKLLLLAWTLLRTDQPFSPTYHLRLASGSPMLDSQDSIPTGAAHSRVTSRRN